MERMVNSQAAEQDLTALLTETGLDVYYGSTAKGVVAHMVRDAEELQNVRTPKTDTPLEAFAGTWTMEALPAGDGAGGTGQCGPEESPPPAVMLCGLCERLENEQC